MSRTRFRAENPKSATGGATAAVAVDTPASTTSTLRRSRRLLLSKNNGSDHCFGGNDPPGVRENAHITITPICHLRRSQRLLQSSVKSSYRYPSDPPGVRRNAYNTHNCSKASSVTAVTTPTCLPRRSQRFLQSNIKSSYHGLSGACEIALNTPEDSTVLRRSKRLVESKTGSLKDGFMQQAHGQLKNSSSQRLGKSIPSTKIGAVRLNFDDAGNDKCHDPIGKIGEISKRKVVCCLPASTTAYNGGGKSELRFRDNDVGARQGKASMKLSSLTVSISKSIQRDADANKRCVEELEGTSCESDSPPVSKLKKRCFRKPPRGKKGVGVKRKKGQNDDVILGTDSGWTKDQEKALQRAYLAAKPTPNFWKRVARLVPGKSSQECFDKVNSENLTPRVQPPRSRCKRKTLSPLLEISFSDSELGSEPKSKRKSRHKSQVNQKMVRNLMRKNSHLEPDKADFFHVLEPTVNPLSPLSPLLSTPTGSTEKGSYSGCRSSSLSNQKKSKSRFSGKSAIPIASPPVLKPVRNLALHDKYVDQLHAREAKRKTRSTLLKGVLNEPLLKNKDAVQAAKESLVSDAKDIISTFRRSEMNTENFNDPEEGYDDDYEDDEDEDEDQVL